MIINSIYVDNIIQTALLEDINYLDAATDYLIDEDQENTARFLAKADGVLCGIDVALRVFEILQPQGFEAKTPEDRRLWARNKWLLAHAESAEAADGAYIGLSGPNLEV